MVWWGQSLSLAIPELISGLPCFPLEEAPPFSIKIQREKVGLEKQEMQCHKLIKEPS